MAGGHDIGGRDGSGSPTVGTEPAGAESRSTDADRSASEKNEADWAGRPEDDGETVKVGARDVERPTGTLSEAEAEAGSGELHDRLAEKDRIPVEEGGSSSLS